MSVLINIFITGFILLSTALFAQDLGHENTGEYIRSNIEFTTKYSYNIKLAELESRDALNTCPLTDMPKDLPGIISQLTLKIASSLSKIKQSRSDQCQNMQKKLNDYSGQIGFALQTEFKSKSTSPDAIKQNIINSQTRQANAVNSLLLTASDMVLLQCVESMDSKLLIQKLIGQATMVSGLFMGGWQGISMAAGGQLISNLPIFRDDVDEALKVLQNYEEKNLRAEFLCLFRQILKMSVLFFASENDKVIQGLDLSFTTGPVITTMHALEDLKTNSPKAYKDMLLLDKLNKTSTALFAELEIFDPRSANPLPVYKSLQQWCEKNGPLFRPDKKSSDSWSDFSDIDSHPPHSRENAVRSIRFLDSVCFEFRNLNWHEFKREQVPAILDAFYWQLKTIRDYYYSLENDNDSKLGFILKTINSQNYFLELKKSIKIYQDERGSQVRLNFLKLTHEIADRLAKKSFKSLFKENHKNLRKRKYFFKKNHIDLEVKKRALWGMLDICQTLDPTLAKFYINKLKRSSLLKKWEKYCVGPKSLLCKPVLSSRDKSYLLSNKRYETYFNSLCEPNLDI